MLMHACMQTIKAERKIERGGSWKVDEKEEGRCDRRSGPLSLMGMISASGNTATNTLFHNKGDTGVPTLLGSIPEFQLSLVP